MRQPNNQPTTGAVIARLRAYAESQNWTKHKFAVEAGLQDTVLRHFWDDKWSPTVTTLEKLERIVPDDFAAPSA